MKITDSNEEIATTILQPDINTYIPATVQEEKVRQKDNDGLNDGSVAYILSKRIVDVFLSLLGLILLSPILLIVILIIKFEDKEGSVLFKQERVGKNGEIFYMYKFRSMVSNAESLLKDLLHLNEVEGAMFKIENDPRITKIGKFIRSTSIDELPQLWNVLKGEMSLVGPRPPLIREVELYTEYEKQRLLVVPGCTGLWQATERNNVGFKEMVELDLLYIKKKSLFYDLKIIILTVFSLISKKAA